MQPRIFGFVDHAHPAVAEFADDAVVRKRLTDQRIAVGAGGILVIVAAMSGELARGQIQGRRVEELVGTVVGGEQRLDVALKLSVAAAGVAKIDVALDRGNVERGLQQ